jgi:hypothetical protein
MLLECCQLGNVRRIMAGHSSLPEGVVAVTFETSRGAIQCAEKMSGRWFDGRQLETKLYLPMEPASYNAAAVGVVMGASSSSNNNSSSSSNANAVLGVRPEQAENGLSMLCQYNDEEYTTDYYTTSRSAAGGHTTSHNSTSTSVERTAIDGTNQIQQEEDTPLTAEIVQEVEQVEDFLNSLL